MAGNVDFPDVVGKEWKSLCTGRHAWPWAVGGRCETLVVLVATALAVGDGGEAAGEEEGEGEGEEEGGEEEHAHATHATHASRG